MAEGGLVGQLAYDRETEKATQHRVTFGQRNLKQVITGQTQSYKVD